MSTQTCLSWPPFKVDLIDPKYKCPVCKEIYSSVYQADDCGCRFCYCCLEKICTEKKPKCPICNFKLASSVSANLTDHF